jgi:AraC family transcriptional regulator
MVERLSPGEYYGINLRVREVAGFRLTECRFSPDARIPKHVHARAHFCVVLGGQYEERYGTLVRHCAPRSIILHPHGEIHSGRISPHGARDLSVELSPQRLRDLASVAAIFREPADFFGGRLASAGARLYREFRMKDAASDLGVESGVLEMLAEAGRAQTCKTAATPPPWLKALHEQLRESPFERFSLSDFADRAGVHVGHLARAFRKCYGCSMGQFVRQQRIDAACKELSRTSKPLSAIAAAAGFYDQAHFARSFKALVGVTPSQFRLKTRVR